METPAKLRWYQFSLQRLFAALTLPAVGLGVWLFCIAPAERQRKGVEMVERLEGEVTYSQIPPDESWPNRQLRKHLPRDYFDSVVGIDLSFDPVTDSDLERLRGLRSLRSIDLSFSEVTDAGLVHLQGFKELRRLNLSGTKVTDAGLIYLQEFPELENLDLSSLPVTDAGLSNVRGLIHLKFLLLMSTQVTDAGMVRLQDLTELEYLKLNYCRVTGSGFGHLRRFGLGPGTTPLVSSAGGGSAASFRMA